MYVGKAFVLSIVNVQKLQGFYNVQAFYRIWLITNAVYMYK